MLKSNSDLENLHYTPLSSLAEIVMGQSPDSKFVNDEQFGSPFLQGNGEFTTKYPKPIHWVTHPGKMAKKGDILISVRAPVGEINIADQDYCIGRGLAAIRFKNRIDPDYGWYAVSFYKGQINRFAQGSTFLAVNSNDIRSIEIPMLEESEQHKIAEILTTVDDAIEQTEALIHKYQRIKQGLMQDLLDNPSWPTYKLGDPELFSLYTGGTPSTKISEYWGGSIPWLSSGEVHKKRILDTEKKITELGYKKSNARYIPVHSTLIALAGQGKTRGTAAITEIEITTNQSIAAIMPNEEKIDPYFLFHSLDYQYLRLRAASAGAGRAGLNLHLLAQFEIKAPNLISEQRRIAEYFESLDNTMHENLILKGKLVQLKQGLMQDLLTGKVRVNALLEQ